MIIFIKIIITYILVGVLFCISETRYRNYILLKLSMRSLRGEEYDHMEEMSKIYLGKVPYSRLRGVGSLFFAPVLIAYILIRYGKK